MTTNVKDRNAKWQELNESKRNSFDVCFGKHNCQLFFGFWWQQISLLLSLVTANREPLRILCKLHYSFAYIPERIWDVVIFYLFIAFAWKLKAVALFSSLKRRRLERKNKEEYIDVNRFGLITVFILFSNYFHSRQSTKNKSAAQKRRKTHENHFRTEICIPSAKMYSINHVA